MAREITATEAMIELAMEPTRFYALARAGRIKGRKVDGIWRVDAADVRKFALERQERKELRRKRNIQAGTEEKQLAG